MIVAKQNKGNGGETKQGILTVNKLRAEEW
jgi:hypothetical protein